MRRPRRRSHNGLAWRGVLGLGAALLVGSLAWAALRPGSSRQAMQRVRVERGDLRVSISSTGEVQPQNRVEIKPPIAGRVDQVLVQEGDDVTQGQVLAWMSSTDRAALLDAAQAQGPDEQARWAAAYKPAPLIAPLAGTVIKRAVEPGQTIATGDPVVVLADRLIIQALVDETDLGLIRVGQEAKVKLDAYPKEPIPATVDRIAYESQLINNVNVYAVDVLLVEVPPTFRSGMTASITFVVADRTGVLLAPSEAIAEWPSDVPKPSADTTLAVFTRGFGGRTAPVAVTIGESDGRMTELLSGVSEGDELVVTRQRERRGGSNPFSGRPQQRRPNRQ